MERAGKTVATGRRDSSTVGPILVGTILGTTVLIRVATTGTTVLAGGGITVATGLARRAGFRATGGIGGTSAGGGGTRLRARRRPCIYGIR